MPGTPSILFRGLTKRCPRCGQGKLFRAWWKVPKRCPRCGLRFEREEGASLGSWAVNLGATELAFGILLVVWIAATWPRPPWGRIMAGSLALGVLFPVVFYPFSKTIWSAVDLLLHRMDLRDWETVAADDDRDVR